MCIRDSQCLALLREFPIIVEVFEKAGSSEDLFFAILGGLSKNLSLIHISEPTRPY